MAKFLTYFWDVEVPNKKNWMIFKVPNIMQSRRSRWICCCVFGKKVILVKYWVSDLAFQIFCYPVDSERNSINKFFKKLNSSFSTFQAILQTSIALNFFFVEVWAKFRLFVFEVRHFQHLHLSVFIPILFCKWVFFIFPYSGLPLN